MTSVVEQHVTLLLKLTCVLFQQLDSQKIS